MDLTTPAGFDVIGRSHCNPVITLRDLPFHCADIWNAGVTICNGHVVLLVSIEMLDGRYGIYQARSTDSRHFTISTRPCLAPGVGDTEIRHESRGCRDPRITKLDGEYLITYVADGDHGVRIGLARTKDFKTIERLGYVSQVDEKGAAMFPVKFGERFAMLKRPDPGGSIWVTYSHDLEFWDGGTVVMTPRGGHWDSNRIGVAVPPIETDHGWLLIYYGEKSTSAGPLVRLGAALLDRDDPAKVLARSNIPILSPREKYERIGDIPNVVFSCGGLVEDGRLHLYYGASDSCIAHGVANMEEIVETCYQSKREY